MKDEKLPKCITAHIDLDDEFETSLARHVKKQGNQSRFLKRLIYDHMRGVSQQVAVTTVHQEVEEGSEAMNGFF